MTRDVTLWWNNNAIDLATGHGHCFAGDKGTRGKKGNPELPPVELLVPFRSNFRSWHQELGFFLFSSRLRHGFVPFILLVNFISGCSLLLLVSWKFHAKETRVGAIDVNIRRLMANVANAFNGLVSNNDESFQQNSIQFCTRWLKFKYPKLRT